MPQHPDTVRNRGYIVGAIDEHYRAVGYDLTVGDIYIPIDGWFESAMSLFRHRIVEEYEIPPQGVCVVFSQEHVRLPTDVCAYAMPKTSLCAEGILVFNTGVVDPDYDGPLSGTTVNFGNTPYRIKKGDPFLRLTFEGIQAPLPALEGGVAPSVPSPQRSKAYRHEKIYSAVDFPAVFLNIPRIAKTVARDVHSRERNTMLWILTVMAILFALLTAVPMLIPKDYLPNQPTKDEIEKLAKEYADRKPIEDNVKTLNGKIAELEKRLATSEAELKQLHQAGSPQSGQSKPKTP